MDAQDLHLNRLKLAEQQFRLACTVNLAVCNDVQTLDVPVEWTFGRHRVSYEDFGLRPDQAPMAASQLELTATLVVTAAIRDALVALFPNPKGHENPDVVAAYQISRLTRNAFSHSMLRPTWSIDTDCCNRIFAIDKIISLDTSALHGQALEWRHYGGPLAIFYFGRFVREILLGNKIDSNRLKPTFPALQCYQQGRLIARRIDKLPEDLAEIARAGPRESIDLDDGHRLVVGKADISAWG